MKTIQELYNEIVVSKELKEQFIEAVKAGKQEAFLKEHGCEATLEEVAAFLKAKAEEDAPLSMDELENSAGGFVQAGEVIMSIFTLGFGCGIAAIVSSEVGHVGNREGDSGMLCNKGE